VTLPKFNYEKLLNDISIEDTARKLGMELKQVSSDQAITLCPFHDDKSPSMRLYLDRRQGKQHFFCFACNAHGDVIDLVKGTLGLDFKEAVAWIYPSIIFEKHVKGASKTTTGGSAKQNEVSGIVTAYELYKTNKNQQKFDVWASSRNLNSEILRKAGFVYSPRNFLSKRIELITDITARRLSVGHLEDAHLIKKVSLGASEKLHLQLTDENSLTDKYFDFFIDERIIFPIFDENGRLVGLAGRALDDAKKINSPKYQFSKGFSKVNTLYRAEYAFKNIKAQAKRNDGIIKLYICEGFLDALRFESLGFNAVAVMGSNLSHQQVQLLLNLNNELPKKSVLSIVLSFDRDEAGLRGASDSCLKLLHHSLDCHFLWPTKLQLESSHVDATNVKDPNDYLYQLSSESASQLIDASEFPPELAILINSYATSAEEVLSKSSWDSGSQSRKTRAYKNAFSEIKKKLNRNSIERLLREPVNPDEHYAIKEWRKFINEISKTPSGTYSQEFLTNAKARINHSRILAYMGARRGELPCAESDWERLDIAATIFNPLLLERLSSQTQIEPIGTYDAVWVPRNFGGKEHRLKMMPRPEDLIIQQYLLNEILTERWDSNNFSNFSFRNSIPAVRYYREDKKTVTTGFDKDGSGLFTELDDLTLSYAYQIDMDVLEGRQPAGAQGMYRPYIDCWRDFMSSLSKQASEIGFVYSIRLDVKRYYDRLRRYVARNCLHPKLQAAVKSLSIVETGKADFASLLNQPNSDQTEYYQSLATLIMERFDAHLFGINYAKPDSGNEAKTDSFVGIPQGPSLSAWFGTIALFSVDQEAYRFMRSQNVEKKRVGYARYVDDIVLLADSQSTLMEFRELVDNAAKALELTLLAKADEIPPMNSAEFTEYLNEGRALAASGPSWEPPLTGDGESGWEFWSVSSTTDRQSALHLLHNVELYKASPARLLQTVQTSFQASDLRTSELSKAARLIWYALAVEKAESSEELSSFNLWKDYLQRWEDCLRFAPWELDPENNSWEDPLLFALEGLEHLIDRESKDIHLLTADENIARRNRIEWLARQISTGEFNQIIKLSHAPAQQLKIRFNLVNWKAAKLLGKSVDFAPSRYLSETSTLVENWRPFEWMHHAIHLLTTSDFQPNDPLTPFIEPAISHIRNDEMLGKSASLFLALLPDFNTDINSLISLSDEEKSIAIQTIVSTVKKSNLYSCLTRRTSLLWNDLSQSNDCLILPPLPGITVSSFLALHTNKSDSDCFVKVQKLEAIQLVDKEINNPKPIFYGADKNNHYIALELDWTALPMPDTSDTLGKLSARLPCEGYLEIRDTIAPLGHKLTSDDLSNAAQLYRALAKIVTQFAEDNEQLELIPAWPYIVKFKDSYFLLGEGVRRDELGNRAFIRDGGRALRTIEVPIFEARLWRVGVAISDYLGLHDDIEKFESLLNEVALDKAALESPARYVLRAQLRKLRGAYANSQIGKRYLSDSFLPAAIDRSLDLLEKFPEESTDGFSELRHVLTIESESACMFLTIGEQWERSQYSVLLQRLVERVIFRLPLLVAENLATDGSSCNNLRRDFAGIFCFAQRLFSMDSGSSKQNIAWSSFKSGVVCSGIHVAINGLLCSMRSHGDFDRHKNFDFPEDWKIAPVTVKTPSGPVNSNYTPLTELFRKLIQHLGHRIIRNGDILEHISEEAYNLLKEISQNVFTTDTNNTNSEEYEDWPFEIFDTESVSKLNFDLLASVANLVKYIDRDLGFDIKLVHSKSFGFDRQSKRFTDSKNEISNVTPWLISQFPHNSKHIEEVLIDGIFHRTWSEVHDSKSGKLLSISALGEPFASIAISKPVANDENQRKEESTGNSTSREEQEIHQSSIENNAPSDIQLSKAVKKEINVPSNVSDAKGTTPLDKNQNKKDLSHSDFNDLNRDHSMFRKKQHENWKTRGVKGSGHVRVAFLQADFDITYKHPFVEATPTNWPFSTGVKENIEFALKSHPIYGPLLKATNSNNSAYVWNIENKSLPSWSEHRRREILKRTIDSCELLQVDLLVLPEYSVRHETIEWLKDYLANKHLSVLAGTYLEYRKDSGSNFLSAPLKLLWPLPKTIADSLLQSKMEGEGENSDAFIEALLRGHVIEFQRNKKYRSIALNEFFSPPSSALQPLFNTSELLGNIHKKIGFAPSAEIINQLLTQTRLPLKHLLELICSEIFLVSSPANYNDMFEDLKVMRKRFGIFTADPDEVISDLKSLSQALSISGDGIKNRRSILAVPSATTRSADYWITGQSTFLAAGTITVFCNSIDEKVLVGGSCFIGAGSWKAEENENGYIPRITPYHGWSKGIFYNNKNDALSRKDQAVVIADIDPYNMLGGKPAPQTLPSPLQLVAYLPIVETVDWEITETNLINSLEIQKKEISNRDDKKMSKKLANIQGFWKSVFEVSNGIDELKLQDFLKHFPDVDAIKSRVREYQKNSTIQPNSHSEAKGIFSSPALYDWIEVNLTLDIGQKLPQIKVPAWKKSN
jgi:DNA primase catalytic core